jgi:hypothetical protein
VSGEKKRITREQARRIAQIRVAEEARFEDEPSSNTAEFLKELVNPKAALRDIKGVGSLMGRAIDAAPGAISAYGQRAKDAFLTQRGRDPLSSGQGALLNALAQPAVESTGEAIKRDPRGAAKTLGRGAMATAFGIPTGGRAAFLGPPVFDEILEQLGLEPPTSPKEKGGKVRQNLMGQLTFQALSAAPRTAQGYRGLIPNKKLQKWREATEPRAVAGALGSPRGTSATQRQFATELDNVAPQIEKYGLVKGLKFRPGKGRSSREVFDAYKGRTADKLEEIATSRNSLLSEVDELAPTVADKLPSKRTGVGLDDLDLKALDDAIAQRELTAASTLDKDTLVSIREGIKSDFIKESPILSSRGLPFVGERYLTATQARDYLENVYSELRKARAYDAAFNAKGVLDPSVFAKNDAVMSGLNKLAKAIRERMNAYADEVFEAAGKTGKKGMVAQKATDYHELRPLTDANEIFDLATAAGLSTPDPSSLVQPRGAGITAGLQGAPRAHVNPLANVAETRALKSTLDRSGQAVDDIQTILDYKYKRRWKPLDIDYGETARRVEKYGGISGALAGTHPSITNTQE